MKWLQVFTVNRLNSRRLELTFQILIIIKTVIDYSALKNFPTEGENIVQHQLKLLTVSQTQTQTTHSL